MSTAAKFKLCRAFYIDEIARCVVNFEVAFDDQWTSMPHAQSSWLHGFRPLAAIAQGRHRAACAPHSPQTRQVFRGPSFVRVSLAFVDDGDRVAEAQCPLSVALYNVSDKFLELCRRPLV